MMNGGRKRRFPITIVVSSILILIVSVVTAQQVFDGNRQVAFVRRQPPFQQNQLAFQQQNRNFIITQPIVSTTSEPITTTEDVTLTVAGTTTEGLQADNLKKVDDIEAAILQAVIESSSPEPPRSSTHRQRIHRIRPGHRIRPSPPAPPPRVDAIEEAVLRAVLEVSTSIAPETSSLEAEAETTTVSETTTTEVSTTASESTSLFPAFASRRHGHRRPPTTTVPSTTLELITEPTSTETIPITTTTAETTTTTSEEPTVTEETTTELVTDVTIALPDEEFEDINAKIETENHQLHQIEENVISALSTPTSTISASPSPPSPLPTTSGPSPPSPPAPPHEFSLHGAGPPGLMPPSDDIVDELNGSSDFLQAAQRLHLLRRLLQ